MNAPSDEVDLPGSEHRERRRGLLYGRRKGQKLSAHQAALFQNLLPRLRLALRPAADPKTYFNVPVTDIWLEIGFGGGEHLLWQAQNHPNIGLIGAEPYEGGVAKLLSKLHPLSPIFLPRAAGEGDREAVEGATPTGVQPPPPLRGTSHTLRMGEETKPGLVTRIRIYQRDARDVIDASPNASLGRVFLLFPDPWPKKRHHKRRFVQADVLNALARVMKPGAELRFASDDSDYVTWTLEQLLAHPAFEWPAEGPQDWRARPADWPPTRYEEKALRGVPVFLRFRRIRESAWARLS